MLANEKALSKASGSLPGELAQKDVRQRGYSQEWQLWVLKNYEYSQGGTVSIDQILQHCAEEKDNFSNELPRPVLGWIVKDLFGEKVRTVRRGPKAGRKQRVYLNLQRVNNTHDLGYSSTQSLPSTFKVPDGWLYIKDGSKQVGIIRYESWEFRGQRGSIEVRVSQECPDDITVQAKSHGCSVDLKKDLGLGAVLSKCSIERQISLAIQYVEHNHLCFGYKLKDDEAVMTMMPHTAGVLKPVASRLTECKTVFSQNCMVITGSSEICCNCAHLQTIDTRRRKRKANETMIHPACNRRFMTKEELECQLNTERMARRNAEKREMRWFKKFNREAVLVEDEDQHDLVETPHVLDGAELTDEMQC